MVGVSSFSFSFSFPSSGGSDITQAEECVTATGKKCTVILGGHSQGGALATVAAIYLHDLNPVVVTAGAPPALYPMPGNHNLCPLINKDRFFRFVAAIDRQNLFDNIVSNDLHYDPVPQLTSNARHIGHEFRLVNTSSKSVAYFYNSKSPRVYAQDYGAIWYVHHYADYMDPKLLTPMKAHLDSSGESFQLGFENGIACNKNSECYSKNCNRGNRLNIFGRGMTCKSLEEIGGKCVWDSDCVSNRCDRKWKSVNPFDKICKGRLELGERCSESSDCLSERCDGNLWNKTCRARLANGKSCNENTDCISEYCPGKWRRVCKDP
ncbi:hypothetical protein CTEN210_08455 [Chaetoceros tenuissimus]|uniref:Fungal lipase-type domain-containing protein n=1 Tax=Chaetoceros tenuissimus TaxID=426638 RepID=A0AAD3H6R1_9STRA|nr:hypothetical protein CTEN210_08455 [Chaetoceros tenuissimus]